MIQQFVDANIGTPVYINPAYVMKYSSGPNGPRPYQPGPAANRRNLTGKR